MADGEEFEIDYDDDKRKGDLAVKVICLGDSAVGKSKYIYYFRLLICLNSIAVLIYSYKFQIG